MNLPNVLAALLMLAAAPALGAPDNAPGAPVRLDRLPDFSSDDHRAAFRAFRASCAASAADVAPLRAAIPPPHALKAVCAEALGMAADIDDARAKTFFVTNFTPRLVGSDAFYTGYYEPVVEGSLTQTADFATPLYGPPADLVVVVPGQAPPGLDPSLSAARRLSDGRLVPLPDRAAIEAGALATPPLVYLHERLEAFFVQVQGSARIRLPDGSLRRLVYAGRNGYPYTSIGKALVDMLRIPPDQVGMLRLKTWIRANGEGPGDAGTRLMQRNRSYVFFRFDDDLPPDAGPIGAEGLSLTAMRSLAIDRTLWPYGLPFYVDVRLPWRDATPTPFRRLMVGQDTGSAILGRARADLYFGTGDVAARQAGTVREHGTLLVLWPRKPDAHGDAAP